MNSRPYSREGWLRLDPVARRLISVRFLRSVAQGALSVDFTLYLRALNFTAAEIGLLLMAGGLAGAVLSVFIGMASDRAERRTFLLVYEAGLALGTALVILIPGAFVLYVVAGLFGFGRGANGASGPFAPAEQAWLAQTIPGQERGMVFSFNAALQFWGMGLGALLAAILPHVWPGAGGPAAYNTVFLLNLTVAMVNFWQIKGLREQPAPAATSTAEPEEARVAARENKAMATLVAVNMINSLGVGLVAPILPYWFAVRYGVGPDAIGPVYFLTFLLTGLASLVVGRYSEKAGLVRSIVLPRLAGVVLMVAMAFMPTYGLSAGLYLLRSVLNRGSVGARQAFGLGLVRDRRRGLASSLNAVSWSVPSSLGPALSGWLLEMGPLFWPFVLAAMLQLSYVVLFKKLLGRYEGGPAPQESA